MSENVDTGGKGVLSSALLVAAVSGILVTGFVLKSAPPAAKARQESHPVAPAPPALGTAIVQEPVSLVSEAEAPPLLKPDPAAPLIPSEKTAAPVPLGVAVPSGAVPLTAPSPLVVRLAMRAEHDHTRLSKAGVPWTAQLIVACKAETVDRLLTSAGSSEKLYVLPAHLNDEACFRVCFGTYKNAKDASVALDLPTALRGKDKISAVEIAKVLL